MSIETYSSPNHTTRDYYIGLNNEEIALGEIRPDVVEILRDSDLSDDDKQRLRKVSADYVVQTRIIPDEEIELRKLILENISSDIPDMNEAGMFGLRRLLSRDHGAVLLVDGQPLTIAQLEVVYTAIEPSKNVLDLAEDQSRPTVFAAEATLEEEQEDEQDLDTYEYVMRPAIEDASTLLAELRPFTAKLTEFGGRVVSIVGLRSPMSVPEQQKIAS